MASVLRPPSLPRGPTERRPRARWIAIGIVSVLLHLTILDLLPHLNLDAADDKTNDLPLSVVLMPPIEKAPVAAPAPTPTAPVPARKAVRTRPTPVREPAFVPESYEPPTTVTVPAPAAAASDPPRRAADPPVSPTPQAVVPEAPVTAPPAPQPPPPPQAVAPRSARLHYKVVRVDAKSFDVVRYYGVGTIDWRIEDGRYRSELVASYEALLIKFDLLTLHSEGSVTAAGLLPDRYTEKTAGKRSMVATNFNRDARQSITFSASPTIAPLLPGAQDRLSVLFQIGALLLADSLQPVPSNRVTIPVAGVRGDVEPWIFEVIGTETIEAGGDPLATTHLRHAPRPDSNDRTVDVWIAPVAGYPAKVLYTEPNGSTIEMTLDRIGRLD